MKRLLTIMLVFTMILFASCGSDGEEQKDRPAGTNKNEQNAGEQNPGEENSDRKLRLSIGDTDVSVDWESNESVNALMEMAAEGPATVQMSMYDDFEQVGSLGKTLPSDDEQMQTEAGDIVLYSSDQIVVFYGSNSWDYTRLGKTTDKSAEELTELLSNGDTTITLEMK